MSKVFLIGHQQTLDPTAKLFKQDIFYFHFFNLLVDTYFFQFTESMMQQYACVLFFIACSENLLFLDDVMCALKKESYSFSTSIVVVGGRLSIRKRKVTKERNVNFSICWFAHLLCVYIVFEQSFNIMIHNASNLYWKHEGVPAVIIIIIIHSLII